MVGKPKKIAGSKAKAAAEKEPESSKPEAESTETLADDAVAAETQAAEKAAADKEAKAEAKEATAAAKSADKMSIVPFDFDEPHATVHGGLTKGRYIQDGRHYDAKFNFVES